MNDRDLRWITSHQATSNITACAESSTVEGSYKDEGIVAAIRAHNQRITG